MTAASWAAARVVGAMQVCGGGDTAVHALDGGAVDFPAGRRTAVTGVSGGVCTGGTGPDPLGRRPS